MLKIKLKYQSIKIRMASQMIGPAQHLTNKKKIIYKTMAAPAAATNTIQPTYKSNLSIPSYISVYLNILVIT